MADDEKDTKSKKVIHYQAPSPIISAAKLNGNIQQPLKMR